MKKVGLLIMMFCAATFAFAKSGTAQSGTDYVVDKDKSTINWEAKRVVGGHVGLISVKEGAVKVDGNAVTGGTFVIDMPLLVCTDNGRVTGHLKNEDFFDVEKFPTSTFVITKVENSGPNATVTGKLTIKGITKDLTFPANITVSGNTLNTKATVIVNRLEYDIRFRSSRFFADLGDRAIEDEFTLQLDVTATKK